MRRHQAQRATAAGDSLRVRVREAAGRRHTGVMLALRWVTLSLLFLAELLAWAGWARLGHAMVGGGGVGWIVAILTCGAVTTLWAVTASPRATHGGPVITPLVKTIVYAVGVLAWWLAGPRPLALVLALLAVVTT